MIPSTLRIPSRLIILCGCLALPSAGIGQTALDSVVDPELTTRPEQSPCGPEETELGGLTDEDMAGLRAAYEADRHRIHSVDEGFQAGNPGQRWRTSFDGRGFQTQPDSGAWTWGLQLESYGRAGHQQTVTKPTRVSAEGQRVAYTWDTTLEEWYINDARGLEHGFTIHEPPMPEALDEAGPLTLMLAVHGALRPEVTAGGRDVLFLDENGATVLTYTGLSVVDADGRELSAGFERSAGGLILRVVEQGAQYPITIDPVAQQAYLKASNTEAEDEFGAFVAISGDTVVVGAPFEDSQATGIDGDQLDNSAPTAGAAYVFVRTGTSWSQQAYLKASNTDPGDLFGETLAISGDTIVIGAFYEDSAATGVNTGQADNSAPDAGAAYVFVRNGTSWSQEAYLKASNTDPGDLFGRFVDISGDTIVVGARGESSSATGVNGDQNDNSAIRAGAVYVFVRNGTSWSQQAYIKASNAEARDEFGAKLAISGDTLIVGASHEDSHAKGVDGDQSSNTTLDAGAAYVFVRNGTAWSQQAYLKASNTDQNDQFGFSVAVSGETAVVSARYEASNATGVNGIQGDDSAWSSGAVYVFVRDGTTWSQQAYVKASNTDSVDLFGWSVALLGDSLIVTAPGEDSDATGVGGDQFNDNTDWAGAAYLFRRIGTNWYQEAYLKASNPDPEDLFGLCVDLSPDTAVVSAYAEASSATGVNGDQSDNSADDAGAGYVFDLSTATGTPFCFGDGLGTPCPCNNVNDGSLANGQAGCANGDFSSGASLTATGTTSIASADLVMLAEGVVAFEPGLFFQGNNAVNGGVGLVFGDGLRCAGGAVVRLGVTFADASGHCDTLGMNIGLKGGVAAGDTRRYQFWYRDPIGTPCLNEFNLTNGLEVTWEL